MEHELKNNKICNLSEAIESVEQKHKKRMRYMTNNIKKKRVQNREELKKYLREKSKNMAMLEMDDEQIAQAERRGDWNQSTKRSDPLDSPKSKKGSQSLVQRKKDLKLYTMKIEQFLSHINVNEEDEPNSPAKITT